ncbi:dTDP-4-dehydrorhamnose reductase [Aurantibacter crassamenti]|uniref:dTDP-4-dehydrorhamnose reductase n=1 Tax=Aurantibacter crassamenti TaxID=1837375 RepID=UPI001939A638|nr:dTDP-4-dehydrorhamnose reductase [Aurantibacter crassamenti]MBM1105250.1 dTDP-4-dehydrorhamnose reductase [Aurantibacter crassamenti]
MKNVIITGGNGQLASCIKDAVQDLHDYNFNFIDIEDLDITDENAVNSFFQLNKPDWCINCAAYTAVDKAETEIEIARAVNVIGAKFLARASKRNKTKFIQVSTDFVFEGLKGTICTEEDETNPVSVYGVTKLEGEQETINEVEECLIIRTSWLYSEYGNNFLKTMLRLGSERDNLNVVCDQIGTPTYAGDLAQLIVKFIREDSLAYGLYHYSNEGVASWYDFALAIMKEGDLICKILPIKTEEYPTPAKRPAYSVMDKSKIKKTLSIEIPHWHDSLKKCMNIIKNNK